MKKKTRPAAKHTDLVVDALHACGFDGNTPLTIKLTDGLCVIHNKSMTMLDIVRIADTLTKISADMIVRITELGVLCDHCGDRPEIGDVDPDACAAWVAECDLCRFLMGEAVRANEDRNAPDPNGADREADQQRNNGDPDITSIPLGMVRLLANSGVCLAAIEEQLLQEVTVDVDS